MTVTILRGMLVVLVAALIGMWLYWWLGAAVGSVVGCVSGFGIGWFTLPWVLAPLKREA